MSYDDPPDLPQSPELPGLGPAAVVKQIRSGRTIVALTVSLLLALVFLAELATGALADPVRLWTLGLDATQLPPGAKAHLLLARGEQAAALLEVTIGASGAPEPLFYAFPENFPFPRPARL